MRRMILVIIGTIFVVGCSNFFHKKNSKYPEVTTKLCSYDHFDSVIVGGDAKVELTNGYNTLEVEGVNVEQYDCQKNIHNNILSVDNKNNHGISARIKIGAHNLKNIIVMDNADVVAKDLNAENLTIAAKDSGSVNLKGKLSIKQIFQHSNGMINISWIDNDRIKIESDGNGPIQLAGVTRNLVAKLLNGSQLNTRYLRAKDAKIFTTDKAIAEVLVLNKLDVFAVDSSNVYYYKRPKELTVVTRDQGNVLYPEWNR